MDWSLQRRTESPRVHRSRIIAGFGTTIPVILTLRGLRNRQFWPILPVFTEGFLISEQSATLPAGSQ